MLEKEMYRLNEEFKAKKWDYPYFEKNGDELWWKDQALSFMIPKSEDLAFIYRDGDDNGTVFKYGEFSRLEVFFPLMKDELREAELGDVAEGIKMVRIPADFFGILNKIIHTENNVKLVTDYTSVENLILSNRITVEALTEEEMIFGEIDLESGIGAEKTIIKVKAIRKKVEAKEKAPSAVEKRAPAKKPATSRVSEKKPKVSKA